MTGTLKVSTPIDPYGAASNVSALIGVVFRD